MSRADLLKGLNESQVAAVTHVNGPMMVLAGPGSGKTRVVTHRIAHLIASGIQPRSIVALTFTNKAAQEMRERVENLVGNADLWMGTFHGFCVRLLRRYARLVGLPENFSIYDTGDAESTLKVAVQKAAFELTHQSIGSLANRISYFKNRLVTPEILESEALSSEEHAVRQVYPYYQQELLSNGAVDFDDILMHTAVLLRSNPELRSEWDQRLSHIMVDEYQDTNLAQYIIVRHLCVDEPNLVATGDPDQSIYGWRGANSKNVTNFERDYPRLKVVRLEENYRSTPQILSAADSLIQHNAYRKEKSLLPTREQGSEVRLVVYPSARDEAEEIADEILACSERGAQLKDFAVLYRTNAQSRLFEHALMRRQLPFQLIGGYRFYMRKEIKDLVAYLLLIHNPEDDVALMRAINSPTRGIGKQTLSKISSHAASRGLPMLAACREAAEGSVISKRAASAVKKFLTIYDQLCSLVHGPLTDLLQTTIELTKYREYLSKQKPADDDGDVGENLDELLAEAYEIDHAIDPVTELEEERTPLERFLEFAALQSESDRFDGHQDQLTLMTMHAAKGLEFSNVYIAAVEENVLPHSRSKDDPLQLEEERRLFFVGITRAKDQLQISYAKRRGFSGQGSGVPSSFLMELPRTEMAVIDKTDGLRGFGRGHFDEYDQSEWSDGEFDEFSQVAPGRDDAYAASTSSGDIDFEDSQLPPEEMTARLKHSRVPAGLPKLMVAGDLLAQDSSAERQNIRVGVWVEHEKFGIGEVIASQGVGQKQSATIRFESDGSRRTFRLSFVSLTVLDNP
ncbi:MAG: ATP-dependent helicase [Aureliella sp.]